MRVRAIDPYSYHAANRRRYQSTKVPTSTPSYLQVGAFQYQTNALRLKNKLNQLIEVPVHVFQKSADNTLYHVTIGPFHDEVTLSHTRQRLDQLGISSKLTV